MSFSAPFRILIIEDNQDLARLFADLMEVLGCTCMIATAAVPGIRAAFDFLPDLIFSDLHMLGEKNGFDVAREIRACDQFNHSWLIAVTGHNDFASSEEARAAGFDRMFAKPVKFAQLIQLLEEFRLFRQQLHLPATPLSRQESPRWTTDQLQ